MPGGGGAVELGELASAVRLGVVRRAAGLLEQQVLHVVDVSERAADLDRQGTRLESGEVQRAAGDAQVHGGPPLGHGGEAPHHRHGHVEPTPEQPGERGDVIEHGPGGGGARRLDDPPAVLAVLHVGDLEEVARLARHTLHRHRVEARHGRARQGGEEEGAACHDTTVGRRRAQRGRRGAPSSGRPCGAGLGEGDASPPSRVGRVALTDETLADLALSRSSLGRVALERRRPEILTELLDDPRTRVAEIRGDRMRVAPSAATRRCPSTTVSGSRSARPRPRTTPGWDCTWGATRTARHTSAS